MRFDYKQEKDMAYLKTMITFIAEQELHDEVCPLFLSQLTTLGVFASKLQELISNLKEDCEESC